SSATPATSTGFGTCGAHDAVAAAAIHARARSERMGEQSTAPRQLTGRALSGALSPSRLARRCIDCYLTDRLPIHATVGARDPTEPAGGSRWIQPQVVPSQALAPQSTRDRATKANSMLRLPPSCG